MVVDDDREFLGEQKELLALSGYEVTAVDTAAVAAERAAALQPDVILLDLKMEGKSGFDVLDLLRNRAETRDIPVVVMSGFLTEESDFSLLSYFNVTDYLKKPFAPLAMITHIEEAARGKGHLPVP
jgi:two-component system, response regulator PdtaR